MWTSDIWRRDSFSFFIAAISLVLLAGVGSSSCNDSPYADKRSPSSEVTYANGKQYWYRDPNAPARVTVRMHDFPLGGEDIRHVYVEIREVIFIREDGTQVVLNSTPQIHDLLTLQFDVSAVIASIDIPEGSYSEIRLILGEKNEVENDQGERFPIQIPSGEQTGIKIKGKFKASVGKQLQIVLDFDAQKSIKHNKGTGFYMTPVVHLDRVDEVDNRYFKAVANELLVKFKPEVSEADIQDFLTRYGLSNLGDIPSIETHLVRIGSTDKSTEEILSLVSGDERLEFAEPNYVSRTFSNDLGVNDLFADKQWNLIRTQVPFAWDIEKGSPNQVIAVLDTGLSTNSDEFSGRALPGFNFVSDSPDITDDNGHGTAVASIIAANTNNSAGIAGINWGSKIIPVKILDQSGEGNYHDMAQGITFAVDQGAKVINISAGGYAFSDTLRAAIQYAKDRGVLVVAAGGNDGSPFAVFPASFEGVIGVGATDHDDQVDQMSNFGSYVDVLAPGIRVPVLDRSGGIEFVSGSSVAAPHVSALASLMLSIDSNLSQDQVAMLILENADPVSANRHIGYYGSGRINALRTLNQLRPLAVADLGIQSARFANLVAITGESNALHVKVQNTGTTGASNIIEVVDQDPGEFRLIGRQSVTLAPGECPVPGNRRQCRPTFRTTPDLIRAC